MCSMGMVQENRGVGLVVAGWIRSSGWFRWGTAV